MWKIATTTLIMGLLAVMLPLDMLGEQTLAQAKTWTVKKGKNIQDVINKASPGDTIIVKKGTYRENINISKKLMLRGENNPAVGVYGVQDNAITLNANGIVLKGFTATDSLCVGIYVNSSSNIIADCIVHGNTEYGIRINSNNNTITRCAAMGNHWSGIDLANADNNSITDCTVNNNGEEGISLAESSDNVITDCIASGNGGIGIWLLDYSNNNTITDCAAGDNGEGGIDLVDSNNNVIRNCAVNGNIESGIWLLDSNNNTITDCAINNNIETGIGLLNANNNKIIKNTITNSYSGIYSRNSEGNIIKLNLIRHCFFWGRGIEKLFL